MSAIEEILVRFHGEHQVTRDLLKQILMNQERMMAVQADIDAAVALINMTVTAIQTAITELGGTVAPADTAALNTAVSQLADTISALAAATPPPAPAPSHVANPF